MTLDIEPVVDQKNLKPSLTVMGIGGAGNNAGDTSGAGGSGVVILRYPANKTVSIGAGLTGTTATDGASKVTTFTAGTGNITFS